MEKNYLNIPKGKRSRPIYRIMPIHRLLEIFNLGKMTLVKPEMWDDPFENWLLKSYGKTVNGELASFSNLRKSLYGQCWTLYRETDAMWRIYSQDKQGVKVKTNIDKLFKSLYKSISNSPAVSCFIGKVKYFYIKDLRTRLAKHPILDTTGRSIAETLLFKRMEFEHEREVRLIYNCHDNDKTIEDISQFKINPCELFDEIVFDPRINEYLFEAYKTVLEKEGYSKPINPAIKFINYAA